MLRTALTDGLITRRANKIANAGVTGRSAPIRDTGCPAWSNPPLTHRSCQVWPSQASKAASSAWRAGCRP